VTKKWLLCFIALALLGLTLSRCLQRPCTLADCLRDADRFVAFEPRTTWLERALAARGEAVHRHGAYVVLQKGSGTFKTLLELGEIVAVETAVYEGNRACLKGQPFSPFVCRHGERGELLGVSRSEQPIRAEHELERPPGLPLQSWANRLHPRLLGWWRGPGPYTSREMVVLNRPSLELLEPLHGEVHEQERAAWQRQCDQLRKLGPGADPFSILPLKPLSMKLGHVLPAPPEPCCQQDCAYLAEATPPPSELGHPEPDCLLILGKLPAHTERLLRSRGERLETTGGLSRLRLRPTTIDSLCEARDLEQLVVAVRVLNMSLMSLNPDPLKPNRQEQWEVRFDDSGQPVELAPVQQERPSQMGFLVPHWGGEVQAHSLLTRVCPSYTATVNDYSGTEVAARYEPLLRPLRERVRGR